MKMRNKILFGIVYSIVYAFLALALINTEVTGTSIFLSPFVTWLLILVALYFTDKLNDSRNRIFFVSFLIGHYLITASLVISGWKDTYEGKSRLLKMWNLDPYWILITISWYLLGQILIWSYLLMRSKKSPENI